MTSYIGIIPRNEKEKSPDTCNSMEEPQKSAKLNTWNTQKNYMWCYL